LALLGISVAGCGSDSGGGTTPVADSGTTDAKADVTVVDAGGGDVQAGQVSPPAFSPLGGTYKAWQNVKLTSVTPNAQIWYTVSFTAVDPSDPVPSAGSSYLYTETGANPTGPIPVQTDVTIVKAIAVAPGLTNSVVVTQRYTLDLAQAAAPSFIPEPPAAITTTTFLVSLTTTEPAATIYYTTDGATPVPYGSNVYQTPLTLRATTIIKALTYAAQRKPSVVASRTYTFQQQTVAPIVFTPPAGTYSGTQNVVLSTATAGATLFYTTDGNGATESSQQYSTAIVVGSNTRINVLATAPNYLPARGSADYVVSSAVADVRFIVSQEYPNNDFRLTLASDTQGVNICYNVAPITDPNISSTPNVADPTCNDITGVCSNGSTLFVPSTPIPFTYSAVVKAVACKLSSKSAVSAPQTYTLQAASVTFSSTGPGTFVDQAFTTMSTKTFGSDIYFTLDGSAPVCPSAFKIGSPGPTSYTQASFKITEGTLQWSKWDTAGYTDIGTSKGSQHFRAIACKGGYKNSTGEADATFLLQARPPSISPVTATYASDQDVAFKNNSVPVVETTTVCFSLTTTPSCATATNADTNLVVATGECAVGTASSTTGVAISSSPTLLSPSSTTIRAITCHAGMIASVGALETHSFSAVSGHQPPTSLAIRPGDSVFVTISTSANLGGHLSTTPGILCTAQTSTPLACNATKSGCTLNGIALASVSPATTNGVAPSSTPLTNGNNSAIVNTQIVTGQYNTSTYYVSGIVCIQGYPDTPVPLVYGVSGTVLVPDKIYDTTSSTELVSGTKLSNATDFYIPTATLSSSYVCATIDGTEPTCGAPGQNTTTPTSSSPLNTTVALGYSTTAAIYCSGASSTDYGVVYAPYLTLKGVEPTLSTTVTSVTVSTTRRIRAIGCSLTLANSVATGVDQFKYTYKVASLSGVPGNGTTVITGSSTGPVTSITGASTGSWTSSDSTHPGVAYLKYKWTTSNSTSVACDYTGTTQSTSVNTLLQVQATNSTSAAYLYVTGCKNNYEAATATSSLSVHLPPALFNAKDGAGLTGSVAVTKSGGVFRAWSSIAPSSTDFLAPQSSAGTRWGCYNEGSTSATTASCSTTVNTCVTGALVPSTSTTLGLITRNSHAANGTYAAMVQCSDIFAPSEVVTEQFVLQVAPYKYTAWAGTPDYPSGSTQVYTDQAGGFNGPVTLKFGVGDPAAIGTLTTTADTIWCWSSDPTTASSTLQTACGSASSTPRQLASRGQTCSTYPLPQVAVQAGSGFTTSSTGPVFFTGPVLTVACKDGYLPQYYVQSPVQNTFTFNNYTRRNATGVATTWTSTTLAKSDFVTSGPFREDSLSSTTDGKAAIFFNWNDTNLNVGISSSVTLSTTGVFGVGVYLSSETSTISQTRTLYPGSGTTELDSLPFDARYYLEWSTASSTSDVSLFTFVAGAWVSAGNLPQTLLGAAAYSDTNFVLKLAIPREKVGVQLTDIKVLGVIYKSASRASHVAFPQQVGTLPQHNNYGHFYLGTLGTTANPLIPVAGPGAGLVALGLGLPL
jgi:hypothetical protein